MILDGNYPMDIRVKKEISSLKDDFIVELFCSKSSIVSDSPFTIHRKGPSTKKISKGFREIAVATFAIDPIMYFKLTTFLNKNNYDFIHVHDLPQFITISRINKKLKSHLILDMHENYPEAVKTWFAWRKSLLIRVKNYLFFNFKKWHKLEKEAVEVADHIIAVVQEMKSKLIREHNVPSEKITVITNSELSTFGNEQSNIDCSFDEQKFNVLYMGGLGPHRGIDDVILAMSLVKDLPIVFHIYGGGHPDNIQFLKNLVETNNASKQVCFHKPVPFNNVASLMRSADLNIIPHKKNEHCDNTIPHKLFQAMTLKKPLLVSNSKPLERTLEFGKLGYIFEADSPVSLSVELRRVYSDYPSAMIKAQNAFEKVTTGKLNWEHEAFKLKKLYSSL